MNNEKQNFKHLTTKNLKFMLMIILTILTISYLSINLKINNLKEQNKVLNDSLVKGNKIIDSINFKYDSLYNEYDSLNNKYKERIDLDNFLKEMALRESSGNQSVVNKYGMMGLYQFDPNTLEFLGFCKNEYMNSVYIQNKAMISYLKFNKKLLNDYINKYDGKYFKGVYITASGILAGAHLTGAGGVIDFFDDTNRYKQYDANKVHVSDYIKEFSGYDILSCLEYDI